MLLLAFLLQEKRLLMAEPKTIYCPKCGRKVATWDGRSTINVIAHCVNCVRRVVYHVDNGTTEIKDIPPRVSSSGMTFY